MDTVEVAYIKNSSVINVLVFKSDASDEELEQFKVTLEADSFKRLAYNEIVKDGVISIPEKPAPISGVEYVWVQESKTWGLPALPFDEPVLTGDALEQARESELNQN
jgi:hypothetical protein